MERFSFGREWQLASHLGPDKSYFTSKAKVQPFFIVLLWVIRSVLCILQNNWMKPAHFLEHMCIFQQRQETISAPSPFREIPSGVITFYCNGLYKTKREVTWNCAWRAAQALLKLEKKGGGGKRGRKLKLKKKKARKGHHSSRIICKAVCPCVHWWTDPRVKGATQVLKSLILEVMIITIS